MRDHAPTYIDGAYCAWMPHTASSAAGSATASGSSSPWRASSARLRSRWESVSTRRRMSGAPGSARPTRDMPDFRATIARGRVRLVDWTPWLAASGPLNTLLQERGRAGVAIADLDVVREDGEATELIARFVAGDRPSARAALTRYARDAGYRRMWLPDDVVELPAWNPGRAETRCTGCRATLTDGEPAFWAAVRSSGCFPTICPLCGSDLPQWRQIPPPAPDPGARTTRERGEGCT